jgi:hypothetical protein
MGSEQLPSRAGRATDASPICRRNDGGVGQWALLGLPCVSFGAACHRVIPFESVPVGDAAPDAAWGTDGVSSLDSGSKQEALSDAGAAPDASTDGDAGEAPELVYYIRADGAGDDAHDGRSWSSALESIQRALELIQLADKRLTTRYAIRLAATTGSQHYAPARYIGRLNRAIALKVEGGFTGVDGAPETASQTDVSRIKGTGIGGIEVGLELDLEERSLSAKLELEIDRVEIVDVMVGLRVRADPSLSYLRPRISLTDCRVESGLGGIHLEWTSKYATHGPCRVKLSETTIRAGRRPTTDTNPIYAALYVHGPRPQVVVEKSRLESEQGEGLLVLPTETEGASGSATPRLLRLWDSTIRNCGRAGIRWEEEANRYYGNTSLHIELDRVRIIENAGSGLHASVRALWSFGSDNGRLVFDAVNSVIADNGDGGLRLDGDGDANDDSEEGTGQVVLTAINNTIVNNIGSGIHSETTHWIAGHHRIHNTIIADNTGDGVAIETPNAQDEALFESFNVIGGNLGDQLIVDGVARDLHETDSAESPLLTPIGPEPYVPSPFWGAKCEGAPSFLIAEPALAAPTDDIDGNTRPSSYSEEDCWTPGAYQVF